MRAGILSLASSCSRSRASRGGRGWIPAFAGMVTGGGGTRPRAHQVSYKGRRHLAALDLHNGLVHGSARAVGYVLPQDVQVVAVVEGVGHCSIIKAHAPMRRNEGVCGWGPFRSRPRPRASRWERGWILAFAGKTVETRRARASGYPEGGGGASGPLTRPGPGLLLSQEWLWGAVVMPSGVGAVREPPLRSLSS